MRYRPLGASGIEASVVGLGTWAIGGWMWGGTDEADSIKCIQAAVDVGMNLIDTAPVYGFGMSEEIVGKAIKGRRDKVVVATKCGLVWNTDKGQFFFKSSEENIGVGEDIYEVHQYLGPESIRYEVESSLKRLRLDTIDLYQTHWQEGTTPIADTMAELLKLKDEGKIRAIGVSNATTEHMDEYRAVGVLDCDQERYSMIDLKMEEAVLPYCADNNIGFLAYSPIGQGLLTGKLGPDRKFDETDLRSRGKRFSVENRDRIAGLLAEIQPVADAHDITLAQLAIAWTVHQRGSTHALVGARTIQQAEENAAAGNVVLTDDELTTMRAAIEAHRDIR
jgi:aryl-alcohol dehydrogenase-like predicted oxidoreductase